MALPFIITIVVVMALGLLTTMVVLYKDKKKAAQSAVHKQKTIFECTIEEMAQRVTSEPLSEAQQQALIDLVAREHKFPTKGGKNIAKDHLDFIFGFCMNPRVNGAMIVKMSNTLKAVNKEYKKEIEGMERKAVALRDKRKK